MKDERARVLAQVRAALNSAHLPAAPATVAPRAPDATPDIEAMVESFARELTAVNGVVYRAAHEADATARVVELARAHGGGEILAWGDADLPSAGLGEALRDAGLICLDAALPQEAEGRRARLALLERATVGVTGAMAGLADTGSLVLLSGARRSRLASLLPLTHIALLSVRALYPTLSAFFAAHPTAIQQGSNLVLITGPSRTADIELTLTRGVHGPREVYVVLCQ